MAIYAVSKTAQDWDGTERFKYKPQAEARFREIAATGHFVRLIRWEAHQPKELERANAPHAPASGDAVPARASAPPAAARPFSIFISYRRDDSSGYTGRLHDRLIQSFSPERIFMDVTTIPLGRDWAQYVEDAVARCEVLLVVIGPQWLTMLDERAQRRLDNPADFVRLEIAAALERNVPVIPLRVGGAAMPDPRDLPEALRPLAFRQGMELHDSQFHTEVDRLIAELKDLMDSGPAGPPPPPPDPDLRRYEAVVRGEGQPGPDGRERQFIAVSKKEAEGFPYREGERVEVELEIGGRVFAAGTRTTPSQEIVYVASDLRSGTGEKITLASVLEAAGAGKNQRVALEVRGSRLRVLLLPHEPAGASG